MHKTVVERQEQASTSPIVSLKAAWSGPVYRTGDEADSALLPYLVQCKMHEENSAIA
jgi:hypothetical protein